nr:HD domain-containing protein [Pseudomonas luteola]
MSSTVIENSNSTYGTGNLFIAFAQAVAAHTKGEQELAQAMGTAALVMENGGDEEQVIAALLLGHVRLRQPAHVSRLHRQFGNRVLRIVLECGLLTPRQGNPEPVDSGLLMDHLAEMQHDSLLVSVCSAIEGASRLLRALHAGDARYREASHRLAVIGYYESLIWGFSKYPKIPYKALKDVVTRVMLKGG